MKTTLATFCCIAVVALFATSRALAAPDELELLLSGDATNSQDQTQPASVESDGQGPVATSSYVEHAPWQVAAEIHPAVSAAAGGHAADTADHKPAPASPINAVPEPSAIILALAALAYFLLFGRRRRVI